MSKRQEGWLQFYRRSVEKVLYYIFLYQPLVKLKREYFISLFHLELIFSWAEPGGH